MSQIVKRLYRSRHQAQLAGLFAGLGEYLAVDPVFLRVVALTVTFMTGVVPGVLSYLAAWIIVPLEPMPLPSAPPPKDHGTQQTPA